MQQIFRVSIAILALISLFSCGKKETSNATELRPAKGDRNYGGVFRMNESENIKTLFPPSITDAFSYRIANQIYEGLLKFDQEYLTLKNGIIEGYSVSEDGLTYTFNLKKGVKFHDADCFGDGKGREVTTEDVKYCFTYLCSYNAHNLGFEVFKGVLKGADAFFEATKQGEKPRSGIEGLKVIDKYTIQFQLEKKSSLFLYNLARPYTYIYPKEAFDKYGLDMRVKPVGTGPFYVSSIDEDIVVILKKNNAYHAFDSLGNRLPFLEALEIRFLKDRKAELLEFKKGNFEMIYHLPTEQIIEIVEDALNKTKQGQYTKYTMQREPEMSSHYLMFNQQNELFKNKNLRKAISFGIDRTKILEYVLQGEGFKAGVNGITPPVFDGYDISKIKGYDLDLDSAHYYLTKAGYPEGKGFPKTVIYLNSDGERNVRVVEEVQKELKDNLNIDIEIQVLPFAQHLENAMNGKSEFFRIGWIADFPNPENFLYLFYGKNVPTDKNEVSFPNLSRYKNDAFDANYDKAMATTNLDETVNSLLKAEQVLLNDAGVIVLWYDEGYRLLQPYVQNFPNNPMQYRDLSDVYFANPETPTKK